MRVSEVLEKRQPAWQELEKLCEEFSKRLRKPSPEKVERFSTLYRAACADLALAESYQLPPNTVDYLQQLVAKAHNQMYRSQKFQWRDWHKRIFEDTPRLIFNDPCVQIATVVFWGLFLVSAWLAYENSYWPGFAEQVVGEEQLDMFLDMYASFGNRGAGANSMMMGYYVFNNAGIGLSCFVMMLFVLPGMITLSFNAVYLGTVFGFMFRPETGDAGINFKNFVTAHGPFELTAIVLAAGAGLKIGLSWLITNGQNRIDSLVRAAREALAIVMTSVVLFVLAAMIEGFISPVSEDIMPWWFKGLVAVFSSCALMFYFVVLGYPRGQTSIGMLGEQR